MCRISTSSEIFAVLNKTNEFRAPSAGSLIFYFNLDVNDKDAYLPFGKINVSLVGGRLMNEGDMDKKLGYEVKANILLNQGHIPNNYNNIVEIQILRYINKARNNLSKFCADYIENNEGFLKYKNEIKSLIEKYNTRLNSYEMNEDLFKAAKEHSCDLSKYGVYGTLGTDNSSTKCRINKYLNYNNIYGETIIYGIKNPLLIVTNILIDKFNKDKMNRHNILNSDFNYIGINIQKHIVFQYCCVLVFSV